MNAHVSIQAPAPAAPSYASSSLQLIAIAEGKARKAVELVYAAAALNRAPIVADRARNNERVDDKLAIAESAVFELLDAILKARASVAPAEEA